MSACRLPPRVLLSVFIGIPAAQVGPIGEQGMPSMDFMPVPPGPDAVPYQKRLSGPKSMKWSTSS